MKGRPRTPTKILQARGSWRADTADRQREPKVAPGLPVRPIRLTGEAAAHWDWLCQELGAVQVVTKLEASSMAILCELWSAFVEARDEWKACKTKKRMAASAMRNAADAYCKLAAQFGLTPSARSRVQATNVDGADSAKARFFKTVG